MSLDLSADCYLQPGSQPYRRDAIFDLIYDLDSRTFTAHLRADVEGWCIEHGCLPRLDCHIGKVLATFETEAAQLLFHMQWVSEVSPSAT